MLDSFWFVEGINEVHALPYTPLSTGFDAPFEPRKIVHYSFRLYLPPAMEYPASSGNCLLLGCCAPSFRDSDTGKEVEEICRLDEAEAKRIILVRRPSALEGGAAKRVWEIKSTVSTDSGTVSLMTPQHIKYDAVNHQFLEAWRHPGKLKPTIMRIYQVRTQPVCEVNWFVFTLRMQIRNPPSVYRAYLNYRDRLEKECDFKSQVSNFCPLHLCSAAYPLLRLWLQGMEPGNEIRRFHGTTLSPECR